MAISSTPPILPTSILTLLFLTRSYSSIFNLIYKGCANQNLTFATAQQSLTSLSSTLSSQSASTKFSKTTSPDQSLFALFQCRGDLSSSDCSSCVSKAVSFWSSLCSNAVAARVQLGGCYALYEIVGFPQVSDTQIIYKSCGGGEGFEERRDMALGRLQRGVSNGNGFFDTSYESVYAMAQCEGDLLMADCGECVEKAVQKLQVECGGVSSGQVYFDKCYISYDYDPDGVDSGGGGEQTGKTVAIVVGGVAALGFLMICLLFFRSLMKKER